MASAPSIESFLSRVRKKRSQTQTVIGVYRVLAFLTGSALAVNLLAYFLPTVSQFGLAILTLFLVGFFALLYLCFFRGKLWKFSPDQAALLTEKKHPELDNALINAWQIKRFLDDSEKENQISFSFIREQLNRTSSLIEKIIPESVIDRSALVKSRNVFLGWALALGLTSVLMPDFLERGYNNWVNPPSKSAISAGPSLESPTQVAKVTAKNYSIEDLALTFYYPAYTRLKNKVVRPSSGSIEVLPGTEARITAQTNLPVSGAELVVNGKDNFSMQVTEEKKLDGRFLVKRKGFYQVRVKDTGGKRFLLAKKYPVTLKVDKHPRIILFLANPKPVYRDDGKIQLFYEGHDDFGIQQVDLVANVSGKTIRKVVKRMRGNDTDAKGDYTWVLAEMSFNPGDEVQYFLEITDNDNVLGPKAGQSESFSFTIFDSRKERENLVLLQEELTEKLIGQLAHSLVQGGALKESPNDVIAGRNLLTTSADSLIDIIGLAQRIQDQAKTLDNFPQPYLNLLKNISNGLTRIREEHIDEINKIQNSIHKPTPVGYSFMAIESLNGRLITHLETDILFLVRMTNRQKMDQIMDLERELTELTESLREEFDKIKDKKSPPSTTEMKAKINQIRKTLQKIMDQLARQTQSLPDEFLNPDAFKSLNGEQFAASLDKLMDLMNQGKMDQALEELKKLADNLRTLSNQLDMARSEMDNLIDMQIMEKLDDSLERIKELEKRQKKLLEQTMEINQDLRASQSKNFEEKLSDLFDELKRDVNEIQSILSSDSKYLEENPVMKRLSKLMDQEEKIDQKIQELGKKVVDSKERSNLEKNFIELNKARNKLSEVGNEIDGLRAKVFQEFKNILPHLQERYDTLEELAELYDLNEFNRLFKRTYPEVYQWQNNLRTSPNRRQDLGKRLEDDVRQIARLNGEISKKLGSMMRMIRESDQSLLSEKSKAELQEMAKQEKSMRGKSEELSRRFQQLNQQNPMISPELSARMGRTGRFMKRAESNLGEHQVQKSIEAENRALKELQKTKELLKDIKEASAQMSKQGQRQTTMKLGTGSARDPRRGGSQRMQKEKVLLPSEDQYKPPREFREEILKAMKRRTPQSYERRVMEYYKELVK